MIKKILVISITIIICIVVILYNKNDQVHELFQNSKKDAIVYTESSTVNLPMEKVRTLNPITSKDSDTYQISKLIFESLFYLDENLSLKNSLASSYNYSEDKMSVKIKIKNDSYFSNGTNVTAKDVKYSIDEYIAAAITGNTIYSSYVTKIKSVSVDKNDNYSVVVKFKDNSDVSMENFVFPIVSKQSFSKTSASKVNSTNFIPIGSGPYAIEKYNDISEFKLVANEYYSGTKPTNVLDFTVLPEKEDVIPLLEVNNISLGFLEKLSRDTLISDKKITSTNFVSNEVEVVGYNFSRESIANKKVRKAIAYAVDVESLNESAYYKNGITCDTLYFPGYLGIKNTGDNYKYDLKKAAELLNSANYLDRDGNGYLEDDNKNELTIDILVNSTNQSRTIVAEAIKNSIDKLSISSRIIYADDVEEFNNKLASKDYDIFVGEIKINETYDLRRLIHSNYNNAIGYSNEKVDAFLDKMKSGITQEQKIETVKSIKSIIVDELPYYCIVYKTYGALTSESLNENNNKYMFNNFYNNCSNWYCKYPITKTTESVEPNLNNNSESE